MINLQFPVQNEIENFLKKQEITHNSKIFPQDSKIIEIVAEQFANQKFSELEVQKKLMSILDGVDIPTGQQCMIILSLQQVLPDCAKAEKMDYSNLNSLQRNLKYFQKNRYEK